MTSDTLGRRHATAETVAPPLSRRRPPHQLTEPEPSAVSAPIAPAASASDLRRVFRRHVAGVAVITASSPDGPVGLLATSVTSLSADPPLVSFNVSRTASSWPAISTARHVGVHLLSGQQADLATRFSRSGEDRFAAPTVWGPGPRGVPVIDGCLAWLVGAVEHRVPVSDHHIVVVRLLDVGTAPDDVEALVYRNGGFTAADGRPRRAMV